MIDDINIDRGIFTNFASSVPPKLFYSSFWIPTSIAARGDELRVWSWYISMSAGSCENNEGFNPLTTKPGRSFDVSTLTSLASPVFMDSFKFGSWTGTSDDWGWNGMKFKIEKQSIAAMKI